jgi:hypothetical protein
MVCKRRDPGKRLDSLLIRPRGFSSSAAHPPSSTRFTGVSATGVAVAQYQREVPAEVKAAALAYERDLLDVKRKREDREASSKNLPII